MVDSRKDGNELVYHSIGGEIVFLILFGGDTNP
jgi:hypothetical protein